MYISPGLASTPMSSPPHTTHPETGNVSLLNIVNCGDKSQIDDLDKKREFFVEFIQRKLKQLEDMAGTMKRANM